MKSWVQEGLKIETEFLCKVLKNWIAFLRSQILVPQSVPNSKQRWNLLLEGEPEAQGIWL